MELTKMTYELAKQLKDCKECSEKYTPKCNKQVFCGMVCYKKSWNRRRSVWNQKYYHANKPKITELNRLLQNRKRATDPIFRANEITKYHKRQALIRGNGGNHTTQEWLQVVDKFEGKCAYCKEDKKLTRDHVIPLSRGGSNSIENIVPACGSCNSSKRNYDKPRIRVAVA